MYPTLRSIHLCLGLFCCLFLLMYGVSAVQMSHSRWFNLKPSVTTSEITLDKTNSGSPRAAANELIVRHGLRGELRQVTETASGSSFRIVRPGTVYEVEYVRATQIARVKTNTAGFIGMLNRIHHVAGVNHEYALINIWGWLVPLVSVMLFVLGATGVYMWFKLYNERVIGIVLLSATLAYTLTIIVMLRQG